MYLFLTYRARYLNLRMKNVAPSVSMLSKEINQNGPNTETIELRETAHELAKNLRLFNDTNESLQTYTHSSFAYFSSFFLPFTTQYKLRVETGQYLSNAESEFNKFMDLADSSGKFIIG